MPYGHSASEGVRPHGRARSVLPASSPVHATAAVAPSCGGGADAFGVGAPDMEAGQLADGVHGVHAVFIYNNKYISVCKRICYYTMLAELLVFAA